MPTRGTIQGEKETRLLRLRHRWERDLQPLINPTYNYRDSIVLQGRREALGGVWGGMLSFRCRQTDVDIPIVRKNFKKKGSAGDLDL